MAFEKYEIVGRKYRKSEYGVKISVFLRGRNKTPYTAVSIPDDVGKALGFSDEENLGVQIGTGEDEGKVAFEKCGGYVKGCAVAKKIVNKTAKIPWYRLSLGQFNLMPGRSIVSTVCSHEIVDDKLIITLPLHIVQPSAKKPTTKQDIIRQAARAFSARNK